MHFCAAAATTTAEQAVSAAAHLQETTIRGQEATT
jgi:hypothetical protein